MVRHKANSVPCALLIRDGPHDVTPALPKITGLLDKLSVKSIVLCWDWQRKLPPKEKVREQEILRFRGKLSRSWGCYLFVIPSWVIWLFCRILMIRPSVVHAMNFSTFLPASLLKPILRYHLIYDIRDSIGSSLTSFGSFAVRFFTGLDRLLMRLADDIIIVDHNRKAYLGRAINQSKRVHIVLNLPPHIDMKLLQVGKNTKLRLNLSGYMSPNRGLDMVLAAIDGLKDVEVLAVGDCRFKEYETRLLEADNVSFIGRVPYDRALQLMNECDCVLLLYDPSIEIHKLAVPNKMYEAMMLGKPIITSEGTSMADFIRKWRIGFVVRYSDTSTLRDLVARLEKDRVALRAVSERALDVYQEQFRNQDPLDIVSQIYRRALALF
jgi:glycosyltransferase involved in cell wall biosynthesis